MRPIRIALFDMPRLLREIVVEVMGSQEDMRIVGGTAGASDADALLRDTAADVLICEHPALAAPGAKERLMRAHECLKVLVLSDFGRRADLHWLEPRTTTCSEVTSGRLLELVRAAFDRSATA